MKAIVKRMLTLAVLLCCLAGPARAAQPGGVVLDLDASGKSEQTLHFTNLTRTLIPMLNERTLAWITGKEPMLADALAALLAARIESATVLVRNDQDILLDIRLPEGNLDLLAKGDISPESLRRAFGEKAANVMAAKATGEAANEVQPGVYAAGDKFFYSTEGQRLLLGNSVALLAANRHKLLDGAPTAAVPDKGQSVWTRTDTVFSLAPSENLPFADRIMSVETLVFGNAAGADMHVAHNYPDILPALSSVKPVDIADMPLLGEELPAYVLITGGSFLDALTQVGVRGHFEPLRESIKNTPFAAIKDLTRVALVLGSERLPLLGMKVPGIYCFLEGPKEFLTVLQYLVRQAVPADWEERSVEGWDTYIIANNIAAGGSPVAVPLLVAQRGNQLFVGAVQHSPMPAIRPAGEALTFAAQQGPGSLIQIYNLDGIWRDVGEMLKPGSLVRGLSGMDAALTPPQKEALRELLASPVPVRQATYWTSPDMRETKGQWIEHEAAALFFDRLYAFVDAMMAPAPARQAPEQEEPARQAPEQDGATQP